MTASAPRTSAVGRRPAEVRAQVAEPSTVEGVTRRGQARVAVHQRPTTTSRWSAQSVAAAHVAHRPSAPRRPARQLGVDEPGGGAVPPRVGLLPGGGRAARTRSREPPREVVHAAAHESEPLLQSLGRAAGSGAVGARRGPASPAAFAPPAAVGPLLREAGGLLGVGHRPPPRPTAAAARARACTGTSGSGTSTGTPARRGRCSPGTASCPLPGTCPTPASRCSPCPTTAPGVSLRAAATEESSGASLVTCASVQRGIAAHPSIRVRRPRVVQASGALSVAVTGTRSPARSTSYLPSASQAEVTGSSRRR